MTHKINHHDIHMITICWMRGRVNEWMNEWTSGGWESCQGHTAGKKKAQVFRTQCRQLFFPPYHKASWNGDQSQPCAVPRAVVRAQKTFSCKHFTFHKGLCSCLASLQNAPVWHYYKMSLLIEIATTYVTWSNQELILLQKGEPHLKSSPAGMNKLRAEHSAVKIWP